MKMFKVQHPEMVVFFLLMVVLATFCVHKSFDTISIWFERRMQINSTHNTVTDMANEVEDGKREIPEGEGEKDLEELDSWGNPINVKYDEKIVIFRSFGLDGQKGTDDDIFKSAKRRKPWSIKFW